MWKGEFALGVGLRPQQTLTSLYIPRCVQIARERQVAMVPMGRRRERA